MIKVIAPVILLYMLCVTACREGPLQQDPVWHFDPRSTMAEIIDELNSDRAVTRHLYSFEKKLLWEDGDTKAYLHCNLGRPVFDDEKLNTCRYTITADNTSGDPLTFSEGTYALLKRTWIAAFGDPVEERVTADDIVLKWKLKGDIDLLITADRRFNNYMVDYSRQMN